MAMSYHPASDQPMKSFLPLVIAITVVAAVLRLWDLAGPSLWIDEIFSVRSAADLNFGAPSKVWGYIPISMTLNAWGIPMDQVSMANIHEWRAMGITEWPMRITSVFFGILVVPLVALVGARVVGYRAALMIALLIAVAPWHIWMSQVARFYSQQFFFAALCLMWYFHATNTGSRRSMVLAMGCLVLSFLSQPPVLVIVGVFALDWLIGQLRREPVRLGRFGWAAAITGVAICIAALALDVILRTESWAEFAGERTSSLSNLTLGPIWMTGPVIVAFAALSALMLWKDNRRAAVYWSLAAVVPIVGLLSISAIEYVHFRYMFVTLMGWLVLAGLGADKLYGLVRPRYGVVAASGGLAVLVVSSMLMNYSYFTEGYGFRDRWKDAFEYVQRHRVPGELIGSGTKASYYLESPDVISLGQIRSAADLAAFDAPVWVVYRADSARTEDRYPWLTASAELKATFDRRVQEPFSSVRVFYFDPERYAEDL